MQSPNNKRTYGFTLGKGRIRLGSMYDWHRSAGAALDTMVQVPTSPFWMRDIIRSGAPVKGMPFAHSSKTRQYDLVYVNKSLEAGRPISRLIYKLLVRDSTDSGGSADSDDTDDHYYSGRVVVKHGGTSSLNCSLMGPLSRFGDLMGLDDDEWKSATRRVPLLTYLSNMSIPYNDLEHPHIYVSGCAVNVSGHVLNYILYTGILNTPLSLAFDLGGFRDSYISNMKKPMYDKYEPSFNKSAWHSWLENEVAIFSGLSMLRRIHKKFGLHRASFKLALVAAVDMLRNNRRCTFTSVSVPRALMSLGDMRIGGEWAYPKLIFAAMPMGTGKSTMSTKYSFTTVGRYAVVDVDECLSSHAMNSIFINPKEIRKGLARKAVSSGDWSQHNEYFHRIIVAYLSTYYAFRDEAYVCLLCHGSSVRDAICPDAPVEGFMLSREATIASAIARDGDSTLALAGSNWDYMNNDTHLRKNVYGSREDLELALIKWIGSPKSKVLWDHPEDSDTD